MQSPHRHHDSNMRICVLSISRSCTHLARRGCCWGLSLCSSDVRSPGSLILDWFGEGPPIATCNRTRQCIKDRCASLQTAAWSRASMQRWRWPHAPSSSTASRCRCNTCCRVLSGRSAKRLLRSASRALMRAACSTDGSIKQHMSSMGVAVGTQTQKAMHVLSWPTHQPRRCLFAI